MKMAQQMTLFPESPRHWAADQRRRSRPARPRPDGRGRHANSLASHEDAGAKLSPRALHILAWMVRDGRPQSDREVRDGFAPGQDMDYVRPRITELLDASMLYEVDSIIDPTTSVSVRRTAPTTAGYSRIRADGGSQ